MRLSVLPADKDIRILAISVAEENPNLIPAQPLFDTLKRSSPPSEVERAAQE